MTYELRARAPRKLLTFALLSVLSSPAYLQAQEASEGIQGEGAVEASRSEDEGAEAKPSEEGEGEPSGAGEVVREAAEEEASPEIVEASEKETGEVGEAPGVEETDEGEPFEDEGPIEVTVAGTSIARTAGSAHIIKGRQLERFEYDDAAAIVQQAPGVYVRQEDGVGLRPNIGIRGVNPDRSKKLTLMEDGILFGPAPYSAPAAYYFPLMTRMNAVRIIKGPGAVAYGPQTVGGAVDLLTRPIPGAPHGGLDLSVGQYGYAKTHAHFGTSGEQFGFLVEGVRLHNSGFKELPSGADTGSTRNQWMVKSSYVVDPTASVWNEFSLKLGYSDEVSNETYLGLTDADFRQNPLRRYAASALDQMKNHRTSVVFSHLVDVPSSSLQVRTSLYRHDYARVWTKANSYRGKSLFDILQHPDDPSYAADYAIVTGQADSGSSADRMLIGPNDRTFVSQGVQSVLSARPKTGPIEHRIEAGVRLHYDEINRRHSESGYLMTNGQLVPDGLGETVTSMNTASTYALATHVVDALSWERLTVTPGVRVELIRSQLDDQLTGTTQTAFDYAVLPGLGAFYALTDSFGFLAGVHRGFSPPPPASKDEPEYSIDYEAGARFSQGPMRLELIGFFNDYSNLTDICTLSSGCVAEDLDSQFDAGRAHIYGFEAFASHEIPIGALTLPVSAAYTFTRANFQTSFVSQDPIYGTVRKGDEIPYIPRHQLNATLGLEGRLGGGIIGVTYVAPMREEAGSGPIDEAMHTDEQLWMDVGGRALVYGPVSVYANVRNLLNAQHIVSRRPYGARPNAPRWIQVGAKVEW